MKKTSLTRALFVAGVMAVAGGMAQADAIFYPDGTRVELGENAVETGLADSVLARSSSTAPHSDDLLAMGVLASQDGTMIASSDDGSIDTRVLGAGPADMSRTTTTTVTTTSPVYVFPNIHFDRDVVLSQPHPMMSHLRSMDIDRFDRTAAATFDSPTRAGEVSTMTSGAPNLVTTNQSFASVPPPLVPDTTSLGAGPSTWSGSSSLGMGHPALGSRNCSSNTTSCDYLPN
jgi:hypothetical protein